MRLINIKTLELEEFGEGSIPEYAILSHRWTNEELTFKEVFKNRCDTQKKGYRKLVKACEVAATYDVDFLWIDTCCIDKRSSAELSEAINSMYSWYEGAKVCLAYLEDVISGPELESSFQKSVWFTRSWTLQELLAPNAVEFYCCDWVYIGNKLSFSPIIEEMTGIPLIALLKPENLANISIATRMSWAADRRATRLEDIAYSLIGIFDVNMALLYGEGTRAFVRLQHEIIRRTEDTSFLLWEHEGQGTSLLASEPADFRKAKGLQLQTTMDHPVLTIMNIGLEIEAQAIRYNLHVYGLLLTMDSEMSYVLLVRKLTSTNAFWKVGVVSMPDEDSYLWDWMEIRRCVVLWDTEDDIIYEGLYWGFSEEQLSFGFKIVAEPKKYRWEYSWNSLADARSIPPEPTSQTIRFDQAERPGFAKLTYEIRGTSYLAIYLFFDFDSCPSALVCNGDSEPSDSAIVDFVRKSHSQYQPNEEHEMFRVKSRGESTLQQTYSFRSRTTWDKTFVKVPDGMTFEDCPIWLGFVPPLLKDDDAVWKLQISANLRPGCYEKEDVRAHTVGCST